jgi:hypothetical protein
MKTTDLHVTKTNVTPSVKREGIPPVSARSTYAPASAAGMGKVIAMATLATA